MRGFLFKWLLFLIAFCCALAASDAQAQGWRLFSGKIKEEAQASRKSVDAREGVARRAEKKEKESKKKREKSAKEETTKPDVPTESRDVESTSQPNETAPPLDLTKIDANSSKNDVEDEVATVRNQSAPVSSGGLLDFSDALEDDAAQYSGDVENEPEEEESDFAPEPPSYRALPELKNDARLNDVCFISETTGWAVGDRGTILRTLNSGATWTLAETPTDANLFAVSFLDENFGLAVGGSVLPSTNAGRGVLLRTVDGGQTWAEVETASFPILRDVRILDADLAWIAGDSSNLYPSGLFVSFDTGIEWTPVEGDRRAGWRAVMFDPIEKMGLGVSLEGRAQSVDGATAQERAASLGAKRAFDLAFDPAANVAWLVGDSGLALRSSDFGANWAQTPGGLPNGAQNYFDLKAVVARDGFVGAVGEPGSLFFYSNDGGNTWGAAPTGVKTPLRKLAFVDRDRGWAVGDLGTIVATTDGGQTWRVQRSGGTRAALLAIFGRPSDVPYEALAQLAGDEGFLTEIAFVAKEIDREGRADETPLIERINEAIVETGAHGATQTSLFNLDSDVQKDSIDKIVARFDAENDGDGLLRFRELLVRLIRTWRPSVLLTADPALDDPNALGERSIGKVDLSTTQGAKDFVAAVVDETQKINVDGPTDPFQELLMRELPGAIRDASDPTAFPEHISVCGLEPWTPLKARTVRRDKTQGNANVDASYFCANLGRPVGEIAGRARALANESPEPRQTTCFQTFFNSVPLACADKTFFDGVQLEPGGDARRARSIANAQYSDALAARAGERRQKLAVVDSLLRKGDGNDKGVDLLLARLRGDVKGVDVDFAVEYLSTVGRKFAAIGALRDAEEAYSIVATDAPDRPQSREALIWLVQYYSGSEPARRTQTQGTAGAVVVSKDGGDPKGRALQETTERLQNARSLGDTIRATAPETFMSPETRFPLAAAQLASGDLEGAMKFYWNRSLASTYDVWGVRAAAEYWLRAPKSDLRAKENEICPLASISCRRAPTKPRLDGELEPNAWSAAEILDLSTPYREPPVARELTPAENKAKEWRQKNRTLSTKLGTSVAFLVDDEYLYIAATCEKEPGDASEPIDPKARRPRDPDLSFSDRVEFLVDLDGDYATAYRFVFDRRGWTRDECWNDPSWNPELFVATGETKDEWNLEVAIPLADLTNATPKRGDVWRIAIRRVAPGRGVECWNVENSDRGENAYGFLNFEN